MKIAKRLLTFITRKTVWIILFPVQWLFFSLISTHHHFIERWYSNGLFKGLSLILRAMTGWIPFSAGEIIIYLLAFFLVFRLALSIARIIKGKLRCISFLKQFVINLLAITSVIYFLFMILWGLNYHREPLVTVTKTGFSTEELRGLCELLIDETNSSREMAASITMDRKEITTAAYDGYKDLIIGDKKLYYRLPAVKKILFTGVFSYLGVTGIYNPFTGEANVNMGPPDFLLPVTVCHEMAHQAGIAPEDEANYVSFIVCRQHPNPFFRYSGYLMAMRYAMSALKRSDSKSFDELWEKISDKVKSDLDENRRYWAKFKNPFEKYSDKVYDSYLKANNQKAGIKSYGLMVRLLLNDYIKRDI